MRSRASIQSHPIHPMLVSFPIGLWIVSFILDVIGRVRADASFWTAGFYLVIGGCIGAAMAALPGAVDLFSVVPPRSSARDRGYIHGSLNVLALAVFIAVAARRGDPATMPDGISLALSGAGVILIGISGWLGGTLAYRNQIGVDHRYANAGQWKERTLDSWHRPVCNQAELGDGQMMLAQVEGERVVIGRCGEGIFAFGDACTHRGGSLSDGALVGCVVQCPWHGSQFDVRTGRVVAGPAQKKILTYKTDIRGGEVYLVPEAGAEEKKAA
jgi:uncharacterized membrane protein/nitrite reductase/ring-hydroxylating ferredoxin subunit